MAGDDIIISPDEWAELVAAWEAKIAHAMYVGNAERPGTAEEAARYDEFTIVVTSSAGDVLAFASGRFVLVRDDEDPRAVDVTEVVARMRVRERLWASADPNVGPPGDPGPAAP